MLDIAGDLVNGQSVKRVWDYHGCGPADRWVYSVRVFIDQWDMDLSPISWHAPNRSINMGKLPTSVWRLAVKS